MTPAVRELVNEAWKLHPVRPPDAATLAAGVAQGQVDIGNAREWAHRNGISDPAFDALVAIANVGPGSAFAFDLWRRGYTDEAGFKRALKRLGLEQEWINAMALLKTDRLTPPLIALAIVRGIIKDPGFLPVGPPSREGKIQAFPTSAIDALDEAAAAGWDRQRLFVQTAISGRPMGPEGAAAATFRGILERVDFDRAIAEGDVRNEWADAIFESSRQIATVADYVQAHLRGHINQAAMHAGAARHGMSAADVNLIYLRSGRPAAPGQMATAAVRGIDGPAGRPMDREQFLLGIAESDIRPEWGPMLWDARFLYPSLFQLTRLVTSGAIDATTGADWAHKARYAPEVVTALTTSWRTTAPAARDPHVVKAENQYWTALHTSFVAEESGAATVETGLDLLGVPQGNHARIVNLWTHERDLIRKQLTPAQIKKAYAKPVLNPATGANWTLDEAIAALVARGYSVDDAKTFLEL